ncbi:SpoIIE family protein phosphatase [Streptomyces sp. NPDC059740]|uniref:SpoIIE family protein phosphatase n=1 Tax=Streptomyces sp. NPDC059740 TaxID=3346926 RepID=UPI00364A8704
MRTTATSQRKVEVVRAWPSPRPAAGAPVPEEAVRQPHPTRPDSPRRSGGPGEPARDVGAPALPDVLPQPVPQTPPRPAAPPDARTSLPGDPGAAATARRFVRDRLRQWRDEGVHGADGIDEVLVDEAVLLVSELVTNAVVHAGTGVDVRCHLAPPTAPPSAADTFGETADRAPQDGGAGGREGSASPATVTVEVRDHHPARAVRGHEEWAGTEAAGGRGLHLVGALAEAWGITYSRASKTVWFRMVVTPRLPPAASPLTTPDLATPALPAAGHPDRPGTTAPSGRSATATAPQPLGPPAAAATARGDSLDAWRAEARRGRNTYGTGSWTPGPLEPFEAPGSDTTPSRPATTAPDGHAAPASSHPAPPDQAAPDPVATVSPAAAVAPSRSERAKAPADPGRPPLATGTATASAPPTAGCASRRETQWPDHGTLSFLAEASDLLGGQLDADQVAALTAQLLVPRVADWCAVWLDDAGPGPHAEGTAMREESGPASRLARVWHANESRTDALRAVLEKTPPTLAAHGHPLPTGSAAAPVPWSWPEGTSHPDGSDGAALACALVAGGRCHGTLIMGRSGLGRFPGAVLGLLEDLSRRVARALATAHAYSRQERISRVLQRRLLPKGRPAVPGMESAVVYEPREGTWAGGDFWDLFEADRDRWCFALGDVCGSGPEAAAVTGLARPVLRLLAREGFGVAHVLDRLNKTMTREAADSVMAVAAAVAAADATRSEPVMGLRDEDEQTRFLSLLYGEIRPLQGGERGVRCTLASAGHPLPLVLGTDGRVRVVAAPQMLLGVVEDAVYSCESFDLKPGETLLCVTDGVTERRSGLTQFDDQDGLSAALAACAGLSAEDTAERIRRTVHDFATTPPDDDLALLVLRALPRPATC